MACIQVLRVETRDRLDAGLLAHVLGRSRPAHARDDAKCVTLADDEAGARARLRELTAKPRPGRPAKHAVDFMIAGPPPFAPQRDWDAERKRQWERDSAAWPPERVRQWADDSVDWLRETFPTVRIAGASLHLDESSPHVHVVLVPDDGEKLSWKSAFAKAFGSNEYRRMQNAYHSAVGKRYGLGRGEVGSDRKHRKLSAEVGEARVRDEIAHARDARQDAEWTVETAQQRASEIETAASNHAKSKWEQTEADARDLIADAQRRADALLDEAKTAVEALVAQARDLFAHVESLDEFVRKKPGRFSKPLMADGLLSDAERERWRPREPKR